MWTTALQIGELVETANDVTISYFFLIILIKLAEPGKEGTFFYISLELICYYYYILMYAYFRYMIKLKFEC